MNVLAIMEFAMTFVGILSEKIYLPQLIFIIDGDVFFLNCVKIYMINN